MESWTLLLTLTLFGSFLQAQGRDCPPCATDATCNTNTGNCRCPSGYRGDPTLACHAPDALFCDIIGDPVVKAFNNDSTRIKLACTSRIIQFDLPDGFGGYGTNTNGMVTTGDFGENDPPIGNCRIVVTSEIDMSTRGQYYISSAILRIVINTGASSYNVERIEFDLQEESTASYRITPSWTWTSLTLDTCTTIYFISPDMTFDVCNVRDTRTWRISTSRCSDIDFVFRTWDPSVENQPIAPGLSISPGAEPIDTDPEAHYPHNFCDVASSNDTCFQEYKKGGSFSTRYGSSVYAAMMQLTDTQDNEGCTEVRDSFETCNAEGTDVTIAAVNECADIPLHLARCAYDSRRPPPSVFAQCLRGFCTRSQATCDGASEDLISSDPSISGCPNSFNYANFFDCLW